jgi:hypothetical protein
LPDICCFCLRAGCDAIHHWHYGSPSKKERCHTKCHTIYHNTKRGHNKPNGDDSSTSKNVA